MALRRPRGTGHLFRPKAKDAAGRKREQGIWWLAYYVAGQLVRESARTTVKTDAAKLLRERIRSVETGEIMVGGASTLDDLATLVANDYTNNGRRSIREVLRAFARLRDHFGPTFLARRIDAAAVEEYKGFRRGVGKSNATINRELAQLRRGLRLAVRLGKLATLPTFALLRESRPRAGFLDPDQVAAVVSHLPNDLRPLITFLYWTGWRRSEAQSLEWRMVDRKTGVIRIEDTKNDEPRTIPYRALPVLQDLIEGQRAATTAIERASGQVVPWVFHRGGERIKAFAGAWDRACRRAGLPGRLVHDMRRSAARNMIRAGVSQSVAMAIGGWKTASIFKRYAIVDERMIGEGLTKLSGLGRE